MFEPNDQMEALKRRRGRGLELTIVIENGGEGQDAKLLTDDGMDGGEMDDAENAKTEELGLAPDILDAESPDNARPDVARATQDGSEGAIDEELGDTDNAADDEGDMKMPSPDEMLSMLGKGRPNGLRARAARDYGKRPVK